ncbi:MAG: acyl-CoA dehydratase activase-related protein [Xylanivirga thermophila]|uniref:acyl-CoA dehydratase activase-related protein n=1 Tax=Xylanivirga thermophila TaxID=2496273 RepID=UPI0039F4CEDC
MRIGIPRGLLYYDYAPFWKAYFEGLGHEVVVSRPTSKKILDQGTFVCVDDACVPVKIFHGHVMDLMGRCDVIFIPRLVSVCRDEYTCPKIIGILEMIKNSIPGDMDILTIAINNHKDMDMERKSYINLAKKINEKKLDVYRIVDNAYAIQKHTDEETIRKWTSLDGNKKAIGLIGHPYITQDSYINMNIMRTLEGEGYTVILPENITEKEIWHECDKLPKKLFWSHGRRILGGGLAMAESRKVSGILFISSFGCGIDAFMGELLERMNHNQYKLPYTSIIVDEQTGQAGVNTRLEAFLDMIEWRKKDEIDISKHGEGIHISQGAVGGSGY